MDKRVISFAYTLKDRQGQVIDETPEERPVAFLEGSGAIIEGLERALGGMEPGARQEVLVRPEDGYGFRDESQIDVVSRSQLPVEEVNVGDFFQAGSDQQAPVVQVVKVAGDEVTLDANHPLAGKDLLFDVKVVDLRPATEEELAHGHAHASREDEGCCGGEGGDSCGCR